MNLLGINQSNHCDLLFPSTSPRLSVARNPFDCEFYLELSWSLGVKSQRCGDIGWKCGGPVISFVR